VREHGLPGDPSFFSNVVAKWRDVIGWFSFLGIHVALSFLRPSFFSFYVFLTLWSLFESPIDHTIFFLLFFSFCFLFSLFIFFCFFLFSLLHFLSCFFFCSSFLHFLSSCVLFFFLYCSSSFFARFLSLFFLSFLFFLFSFFLFFSLFFYFFFFFLDSNRISVWQESGPMMKMMVWGIIVMKMWVKTPRAKSNLVILTFLVISLSMKYISWDFLFCLLLNNVFIVLGFSKARWFVELGLTCGKGARVCGCHS